MWDKGKYLIDVICYELSKNITLPQKFLADLHLHKKY